MQELFPPLYYHVIAWSTPGNFLIRHIDLTLFFPVRVPIRENMKTRCQYRQFFYRYDNFTFAFKAKTVKIPLSQKSTRWKSRYFLAATYLFPASITQFNGQLLCYRTPDLSIRTFYSTSEILSLINHNSQFKIKHYKKSSKILIIKYTYKIRLIPGRLYFLIGEDN